MIWNKNKINAWGDRHPKTRDFVIDNEKTLGWVGGILFFGVLWLIFNLILPKKN